MRIGNIISMNISDASALSDYGQQLEIKERIGAIRTSGIPLAAIEHFVLVRSKYHNVWKNILEGELYTYNHLIYWLTNEYVK